MQNGSVIQTKRRSGQSVSEFRRRDRTSGKAVYRRIVVGTMEQYKTEADAREIVEGIVLEINSDDLRLRPTVLTVSQLIEHYRRRELSVDNTWKSYATKMGYENYLKRWIAPIFLDATTGLRQSELFGLRWSDLDFDNAEINVVRSVVHGVISRCKTESSAKPIPMAPLLAEMLKEWRKVTRYRSDNDWVFASKRAKGKRPIWGQSMMRKQIHPALEKLGINKRIGWHTFRHSFSTLLRHLGTDIKVQQDLLRHSSARLTLDTYTQAVTPAKRDAQNAVVELLFVGRLGVVAAPTVKI